MPLLPEYDGEIGNEELGGPVLPAGEPGAEPYPEDRRLLPPGRGTASCFTAALAREFTCSFSDPLLCSL